MTRPTKSQPSKHRTPAAFRRYLNAMDAASPGPKHKHGRYEQRTRPYGDYLYAQDRDRFNANYAEWLEEHPGTEPIEMPTPQQPKIKLTDPQFAFLSELVKGPTTAVESYGPARKLVEVGFATRGPEGRYGASRLTVTDAGRAHHQAIHMADKVCSKCKKAPWTCRACRRKTCEHYCSHKGNDGMALCGRVECRNPPLSPKSEG